VTGRPVATGWGRQVDRTVPGPPVVGWGNVVGEILAEQKKS